MIIYFKHPKEPSLHQAVNHPINPYSATAVEASRRGVPSQAQISILQLKGGGSHSECSKWLPNGLTSLHLNNQTVLRRIFNADPKQTVNVNTKPTFKSTSLNWDMHSPGTGLLNAPILNPRDVIQVAFLLEQQPGAEEANDESGKLPPGDTRRILGQLAIQWRSALGDRGSLSTGWLTSRR